MNAYTQLVRQLAATTLKADKAEKLIRSAVSVANNLGSAASLNVASSARYAIERAMDAYLAEQIIDVVADSPLYTEELTAKELERAATKTTAELDFIIRKLQVYRDGIASAATETAKSTREFFARLPV